MTSGNLFMRTAGAGSTVLVASLNDHWRVVCDGPQWVLQRFHENDGWRARACCRTRQALERCLEIHVDSDIDPTALAILSELHAQPSEAEPDPVSPSAVEIGSKRKRRPSPADVREWEINRVIDHVFGASLPDDDDGREVVYELLNQLALRGASPDEMRDIALDLLPELDDDDSLDILIKGIGKGRRRRADQVARALGVTYEMRTFLDLRTIGACDMSKKERDAIQRQKEAADKRWQREQAGAKPHARSAAKIKLWLERGCSRSTYYKRKAAAENAKNSSSDCFGDHTLSIFLIDKSVSGDPPAGPCRGTTDAGMEHGGEASDFIAEPLSQPDLESVVSELPASYGAVFSAEAMSLEERARRHLQAVASAVARSPDPERWQHLIVAASGAWARAKFSKPWKEKCDER